MKRLFLPILIALLAACSSPVYKIDVRQGNLVTQPMVAQLKQGLTKDQVRFILGTPLVVDVFHADRWDYLYRFQPGRDQENIEQRHLIVFFENGKLSHVGGDVQVTLPPATAEMPARPAGRVVEIAPSAPPQTEPAN
jgi:outer membrane protein assembly factor BamE